MFRKTDSCTGHGTRRPEVTSVQWLQSTDTTQYTHITFTFTIYIYNYAYTLHGKRTLYNIPPWSTEVSSRFVATTCFSLQLECLQPQCTKHPLHIDCCRYRSQEYFWPIPPEQVLWDRRYFHTLSSNPMYNAMDSLYDGNLIDWRWMLYVRDMFLHSKNQRGDPLVFSKDFNFAVIPW